MARYPKMKTFQPELMHRMSDKLIRVRVGISTKIWSIGVMRKVVQCTLCDRTIPKGQPGWREMLQTSLYRAKRVCTRCWPKEETSG